MDSNKWHKLVIKEFISSNRRAALYFVVPEFESALVKLKSLEKYNLKFLFPIKSFNHPTILGLVSRYTSGFDVSNENEYKDVSAFLKPDHIVWSSSPINSLIEGVHFNDLNSTKAFKLSDYSKSAIRINPDFLFENNRFGIDSSHAKKLLSENETLVAIHCHLSGIMNKKEDFLTMLKSISDLIKGIDRKLSLNFGGGLSLLDFDSLKEVTSFASELFSDHQVYFEPGRWLSKQCGIAVGKVMATERNIVTTTLSAACHLRWLDVDASISFTSSGNENQPISYHIYGPTCFENDRIGTLSLPENSVSEGQLLLINHVSGYSYGWNHAFNGVEKADIVFLGASG